MGRARAIGDAVRVAFDLDGREVSGLASTPNAIGVCAIQVYGENYARHVSRLRPLDEEAEKVLRGGDRFVEREPEAVIARISSPEQERPRDWTIADLDLLRLYTALALMEAQKRLKAKNGKQRHRQLFLAIGVIRRWLKQSRMQQTSLSAGLSDEQAKDPISLLRVAKGVIANLARIYYERVGEEAPREWKQVATVINDYLNHHASPSELK